MLARTRSLAMARKLHQTSDIQAEVFKTLFSSEAAGNVREEGASPVNTGPPKIQEGGHHKQGKWQRHKAQRNPGAVRGSNASGTFGRYQNTWPVAISNMPCTAVAADILHFLPPLGLAITDVKPEFDVNMRLVQFWVAMHSPRIREMALELDRQPLGTRKVLVRPGTPMQMEAALNRRFASSSKGRYVMITGLKMKATTDDVMRLFPNFDMLPASVSMLMTGLGKKHRRTQLTLNPNGQQVAIVRFESYEEANRACRTCNFGFVRTDLIRLNIII